MLPPSVCVICEISLLLLSRPAGCLAFLAGSIRLQLSMIRVYHAHSSARAVLDVSFGPDAADRSYWWRPLHIRGDCVMDARRLLCLVLLTSLLAGCAQSAAIPTPTPAPRLDNPVTDAPYGLCLDSAGWIYVADWSGTFIVRFGDMAGTNWTKYVSHGQGGVGSFNRPAALAVDAAGRIYVADPRSRRIVRMDDMNGTNWTTFP